MENRYLDRRKKARQQLGLHEAARAICHPALPICDSYLLSWCRGQRYFGPMPARSYRSAPSVLSSSYPSWNKFNGQWLSRRQSNVLGAPSRCVASRRFRNTADARTQLPVFSVPSISTDYSARVFDISWDKSYSTH